MAGADKPVSSVPASRKLMPIAEVPPEQRAELLAHFERAYPTQEIDPWAP